MLRSAGGERASAGRQPLDHAGNPILAGDVDGDGTADLFVGAIGEGTSRGAIFVRYGPLGSSVSQARPDARLVGAAAGDEAGCSVALVDLDGDSVLDMAVGALGVDGTGTDSGAVAVVLGPATGVVDLTAADFTLVGSGAGSQAGEALSAADVDGDGRDDLLIGGWMDSAAANEAGAVWAMFSAAE